MAGRIRRIIAVLIVVAAIGAVKWFADPARSRAFLAPSLTTPATMIPQVLPALPLAAPKVSIVFVIDSSSNMQPRVGRNYFEMAKEGIVKFLEREGFRDDGTFEISVIQYAKKDVPGYVQGLPGQTGTYHWFGPVHVVSEDNLSHEDCEGTNRCAMKVQIIALVKGIEHTKHFTGMLLESGLNEARKLAEEAHNGASQVHVILLSTGEYRLPKPWPPAEYCPDALNCPSASCDESEVNACSDDECTGSRACHIRHYANVLRDSREGRTSGHPFLSAIQLGPNFRNNPFPNTSPFDLEVADPYGATPHYCISTSGIGEANKQPDRSGFLKELCNWENASSATASDTNNSLKCDDNQRLGKYERIVPVLMFGTLDAEGGPSDIERTIANWMCEWMALGSYNASQNVDEDYFNPNHSTPVPIYDICDNCPQLANPRQRDCNADGIGDLCQTGTDACIDPATQ